MSKIAKTKNGVVYSLDENGCFVIEDYNRAKSFSNFFPGIAGVWGVPMWAFFVNRGQAISSFGIESKDKALLEFQPANKAYRLTALQGFRTCVKLTAGSKTTYWEPFQVNIKGTQYKHKQTLVQSAHDLKITDENFDLGLRATVEYFTLPEEPYAALVRRVNIENIGKRSYKIELLDGLPMIVPYGLSDGIMKNMSRTAEAWVHVAGVDERAPYYRLNVEISDTPQVTHIKEGNFFFSFDPTGKKDNLLPVIADAAHVFGESMDFSAPNRFLNNGFKPPREQHTSNRTPSAMSFRKFSLKPKEIKGLVSLFGYAKSRQQLRGIVRQTSFSKFIDQKARRNREIIEGIKNFALTKSASKEFDFYASHTFLDNILRGGLPVSLHTDQGPVAFNVFSRKHGDPERDYNFFLVSPTYFSQGNGNYRDVNQNRRNDIWFNRDVKDDHVVNFLNLVQADGYNPLVTKGTAFVVHDQRKLNAILKRYVRADDIPAVAGYIKGSFVPGELLRFIEKHEIKLKASPKAFLADLIEICHKHELAEHGEGFWSDHWTYNLDLIESYLKLNPENMNKLLLNKKHFHFYLNSHYVLPREHRYILNHRGVRQYRSVVQDKQLTAKGNRLKTKNGGGSVYKTTLFVKLLCLVANKAATLDPSGIGIEMEADKPNWYDALNGLPGLLGSSISETIELKRLSVFLLESLKQSSLPESRPVRVFEELATFVTGLTNVLSVDHSGLDYWNKANDIKERYRQRVRGGIDGKEAEMTAGALRHFLELVIAKADKAVMKAKDRNGFLPTYFFHQVEEYKELETMPDGTVYVRPLKFKRHDLPLFLEGYVHALRACRDKKEAKLYYRQVRRSGLYDKKLKMYKVNADLTSETEEIGRSRIFPRGWLENESIWLHMEYKFMLELLRGQLFDEFFENFPHVLVPFQDPARYGRSVLENSSFIVSSVHEDGGIHGQGFVARLSGSTAEFLHIWLLMNAGLNPFRCDAQNNLTLTFDPVLKGDLFTKSPSTVRYAGADQKTREAPLPANTYAFNFLGSTLVVYHNPGRKDTYGKDKPSIRKVRLAYTRKKRPIELSSPVIADPYAREVREGKVARIDVHFE